MADDSSVPEPHCVWDPDRLATLLASQDFGTLMSKGCLYALFDTHRLPQVVDWCESQGADYGHVPIIYMYLRNLLAPASGTVMGEKTFLEALYGVVAMLLRTAQDIACCTRLFAAKDAGPVYGFLRAKLSFWLRKFRGREWPDLAHLVSEFDQFKTGVVVASPAWATACTVSMVSSNTIYFATPKPEVVASVSETEDKAVDIRAATAEAFLEWAAKQTWESFLDTDFES